MPIDFTGDLFLEIVVAVQAVDDPGEVRFVDAEVRGDVLLSAAGGDDRELEGRWLPHDPTNRSTTELRLSSHWSTSCMPSMARLLFEVLPGLRKSKGWTVWNLAEATVLAGHPIPQKSIEALESPARAGQLPKAATLRSLATALEVDPEVFYEWPIAIAQEGRRGGATQTPEQIAQEEAQRRRDRPSPSRPSVKRSSPRGRAA